MGQEIAKLIIVYAITGAVVLLSIPVLGKEKVIEILGGTSIEVIVMFGIIGVALGVYAFIQERRGKAENKE